ncbi:MAG: class I SAM-dependent rRNA methyltransferase [Pseudomonadota bacterium]
MTSVSPSLPPLRLKKNEERRLRAGHAWIYSNEIDTEATPLKAYAPGMQVTVQDSRGKPLGSAFVNPNTLIAARLYSREADKPLDQSLLVHRLNIALSLREKVFATPHYRLVYGDSDGLPGLVVDRYDDVLVVQIGTAGMEKLREQVIAALVKVLKPFGILLRNDASVRALEGLPEEIAVAHGTVPEQVELVENGVRFRAPVRSGQKTGWFYDHRDNRARLMALVAQAARTPERAPRVLDVFSYIGGWGVQAAVAGAADVLCVDASAPALALVGENAALNDAGGRVRTLEGDAFQAMKSLLDDGERFDIVVMDPPAFIKRRKDVEQGTIAYRRVNELAMRLLQKDGLLVSGSCSMHLSRADLLDVVRATGRQVDRHVQVIAQGGQGADHPVLPAIPETDYLKAMFARVTPTF